MYLLDDQLKPYGVRIVPWYVSTPPTQKIVFKIVKSLYPTITSNFWFDETIRGSLGKDRTLGFWALQKSKIIRWPNLHSSIKQASRQIL